MKYEQMIAVLRQNRLLVSIVGLILVINVAVMLRLKDQQVTTMAKLQQSYESKRKARLPERSDPQRARWNQSREDVLRFVGLLPDKLMIPEVMQEVLELLTRSGLAKVNMTFTPESADFPGIMRYTTSFSVNGNYPMLKAFLAGLQNSKTLFCIEGLSLVNQKEDDHGPVSLNLKLALYLRS